MRPTTAEELMTRALRTVTPDHNLSEVREIFELEGFRHMPVVDEEGLVGIISKSDLLRMMQGASIISTGSEHHNALIFETTKVGEVMTRDVKTVGHDTPVSEAAHIMVHYKLNALPVTENGEIVGLITSTDLLLDYIDLVR